MSKSLFRCPIGVPVDRAPASPSEDRPCTVPLAPATSKVWSLDLCVPAAVVAVEDTEVLCGPVWCPLAFAADSSAPAELRKGSASTSVVDENTPLCS